MSADTTLPPGLLASLEAGMEPYVLLIRHGDRPPIPAGDPGETTPLTEQGEARTRTLARRIGAPPAWALASPLLRCVRTAELLGVTPTASTTLGAPGAFVVDTSEGGRVFTEHDTSTVIRGQLRGETWGCMRPLADGAARIHILLQSFSLTHPGIGVAVSHDSIVMPYIAWATGYDFDEDWLEPLDGVLFTFRHVLWRGRRFEVPL